MVKGVIKVIKLNSRVKEYKMSWYIHHVNLEAHDVAQTANFFRDIIGLKEGQWTYPEIIGKIGHSDDTLAYFGTENQGLHIVLSLIHI